ACDVESGRPCPRRRAPRSRGPPRRAGSRGCAGRRSPRGLAKPTGGSIAACRPGSRETLRTARAASDALGECYTDACLMPSAPSRKLERVPNPHPDRDYEVDLAVPEFTCLCPLTGQPDFAAIRVRYVPDQWLVELKSLKLYMLSTRPAISIPSSYEQPMALVSCAATCSNVWQSQFQRMVIHGGGSPASPPVSSSWTGRVSGSEISIRSLPAIGVHGSQGNTATL